MLKLYLYIFSGKLLLSTSFEKTCKYQTLLVLIINCRTLVSGWRELCSFKLDITITKVVNNRRRYKQSSQLCPEGTSRNSRGKEGSQVCICSIKIYFSDRNLLKIMNLLSTFSYLNVDILNIYDFFLKIYQDLKYWFVIKNKSSFTC